MPFSFIINLVVLSTFCRYYGLKLGLLLGLTAIHATGLDNVLLHDDRGSLRTLASDSARYLTRGSLGMHLRNHLTDGLGTWNCLDDLRLSRRTRRCALNPMECLQVFSPPFFVNSASASLLKNTMVCS